MKYFAEVHTLDELKKKFRRLAMLNHPDVGGDTATMQEINAEYDRLFPIMKLAYNREAEQPTHETAESTRSEFYTQNGWKGGTMTAACAPRIFQSKSASMSKRLIPIANSVSQPITRVCAAKFPWRLRLRHTKP